MDVQCDRTKLLALVTTIMLCGVSALYSNTDKETVTTEPAAQASSAEEPGRHSIRGADTQLAEEEIRNPFTLRHETVREDSQAAAVAPKTAVSAAILAEKERRPLPKGAENMVSPARKDQVPVQSCEPELCGIMQDSDGQVAILRFGEQTAVLAVGEAFDDWALVHMDAGSVILRKDWQEKRLSLRLY